MEGGELDMRVPESIKRLFDLTVNELQEDVTATRDVSYKDLTLTRLERVRVLMNLLSTVYSIIHNIDDSKGNLHTGYEVPKYTITPLSDKTDMKEE